MKGAPVSPCRRSLFFARVIDRGMAFFRNQGRRGPSASRGPMRFTFFLGIVLIAGCDDGNVVANGDGAATVEDLAHGDIAPGADTAVPADLAPGPDIAGADLAAGPDLAAGADLAIGPDLVAGRDLAIAADLVPGPDLAPPRDLAV